MSLEIPIEITLAQAHLAAIDDVNRWRGRCIALFANIEQSMTAALRVCAGDQVAVPSSLSAKICAIQRIVATGAANPNPKFTKALESLLPFVEKRNLIVHAAARVWVCPAGNWLWAYRFTPSGKGKPEQNGHWLKTEAEDFEKGLSRTKQSLCGHLETLVGNSGASRRTDQARAEAS